MSHIPAYSSNLDVGLKKLTPEQQIERKHSHIEHCIECQNALDKAEKIDQFSILFLLFLNKSPIVSVLLFMCAKGISMKMKEMILGVENSL